MTKMQQPRSKLSCVHLHCLSELGELFPSFVLLLFLCCQALLVNGGPMRRPGAQFQSLGLCEQVSFSVCPARVCRYVSLRLDVRSCLVHFVPASDRKMRHWCVQVQIRINRSWAQDDILDRDSNDFRDDRGDMV